MQLRVVEQDRATSVSDRARTLSLWVVLLAFFMDLLDATIVNVALPAIRSSLGATYAGVQWIVAAYALAFAVFLIVGGRLGDIFGYRRVFLTGMAAFTAASALCGVSTSTGALIAARAAQGFAAALMVPQILSIIQVLYRSTEARQRISPYYGALAGVATVAGPVAGALLTASDVSGLGWRAIFLVNVPVGVVALVLGAVSLPSARAPQRLRVDMPGVAVIVVAMLMLMFPLIQGHELGWAPWTFASMAASALAFFAFARLQRRSQRLGRTPLVVPSLFQRRSFVVGASVAGGFHVVAIGFLMVLTIYLQNGLGYTVLQAGLTGIPFSLGVSVASCCSGPLLVPRFGRRVVTAGPVIMAVGLVLLVLTIRHGGARVDPLELAPALLTAGCGMGLVVASIYPFLLAEVPVSDAGSASGVINATTQLGGALGIAVVGALFFSGLAGSTEALAAGPRAVVALERAGLAPRALTVFDRAFERALWCEVLVLLGIALLSALLPRWPRGRAPALAHAQSDRVAGAQPAAR